MSNDLVIFPSLSIEATFAIVDKKGKYANSTKSSIAYSDDRIHHTKDGLLKIKTTGGYYCREALCNTWESYLEDVDSYFLEEGSTLTTKLPRGKKVPALIRSTLSSHDGIVFTGMQGKRTKYADNIERLLTNTSSQKKLTLLLDVLLGCYGMLCAGPGAFVRRGPPKKIKYRRRKGFYSHINGLVTGELVYDGLSSFWCASPILVSLTTGMFRTCLDWYFIDMFDSIDKRIKLKRTHERLIRISKKKKLSTTDKAYLFSVLRSFRSYFLLKRIESNPAHHPVNKWTWAMFTQRLLKEAPVMVNDISKNVEPTSVYGNIHIGFIDWCRRHKRKTKSFSKRGQKYLG